MKPLKDWDSLQRGYKFREWTYYDTQHLGTDFICFSGTPVYAPFDGRVTTLVGTEGGNTVWFYYGDYIMRFMHLSKFGAIGNVKEGDIIGYVGSTGSLSTGPHLHLDISLLKVDIQDINNFLDPEGFNWEANMGFSDENVRLILESGFRQMRKTLLGKVDEKGLQADCDAKLAQTKTGNVEAVKDQFNDYMKAEDIKYQLKSVCLTEKQKLNDAWKTVENKMNDRIYDLEKELSLSKCPYDLTDPKTCLGLLLKAIFKK